MQTKTFRWSEEEIQILKKNYTTIGPQGCQKLLKNKLQKNRSIPSITGKAHSLNLYVTSGRGNSFKHGHTPWNKGKKVEIAETTKKFWFKKGTENEKWVPIGSERLSSRGYYYRKVRDTGNSITDWEYKHRVIWEEHYGKIPKGHVVRFINGDKTDFRIENLQVLSRKEHLDNYNIHKMPEHLKRVIRTKARLVRVIREMSNEKQN